ncbi:MAG: peptide-N-glycosidase F-related protein [Bacteroidia bacterium]
MKKTILLTLISFCTLAMNNRSQAQLIQHLYDFNSLTSGNLNGQDGWTTVLNTGGTDDFSVAYDGGTGTASTPDTTLGIFYNHSGGNWGRTASRTTTAALPFDFSTGGVMQIEVDIYTAWWGIFFGFGYDANNNGFIIPGIEQVVNYQANEGGFGIYLSQQGAGNTVFIKPDGTKIVMTYDSLIGWNHYSFFLDLDANGGAGSISLSAKKPGGNYVNIQQVQNLNLGLTPGSGDRKDPAMWTKLFLQALGSYSAFDNVIISAPNTGGLLYQYLTFDNLQSNFLTTDPPFTVNATSSKGLPVNYTITGPATIAGNLVTLTGTAGTVTITAHQPGNATVVAAADISVTVNVVDPLSVIPDVDIKNPVNNASVSAPQLDAILLSAATKIDYPELLNVSQVVFNVNGQNIAGTPTDNGYYRAYWTPPSYGTYTLNVTATSSANVAASQSTTFQVVAAAPAMSFKITDTLTFANVPNQLLDTTLIFPSFAGTYSKVTAYVNYQCPPGGCNAYDVIADVNIRGANGYFVQLLRYITPFGVACMDSIDVTDFVSQLQGKIDVSVQFPAMSKVTITLQYYAGTPQYKYSWMEYLWNGIYPFGKYVTSTTGYQPVEIRQIDLTNPLIQTAYIREVSSGHGWGNFNTGNAAEFYNATHHFKINGVNTFTQNLWRTCTTNPAGCSPQSGTWTNPRAGWCPGSIPMLWQFNLASQLGTVDSLMYEFAPNYVDLCSAFNPNCNGTVCSNCFDTGNPNIHVAGELVTNYNVAPTAIKNIEAHFNLNLYPNPSKGVFNLSTGKKFNTNASVEILNLTGAIIKQFNWDGGATTFDMTDCAKGIYILKVNNQKSVEYKKIALQ